MSFNSALPRIAVVMAVAAMIVRIPLAAAAGLPSQASPAGNAAAARDLELGQNGLLKGQIVTAQGAAAGGQQVAVYANGQQVATVTTAEDGTFAIKGLRGGMHKIVADGSVAECRLWTAGCAPPIAQQAVLIVTPTTHVRGQGDDGLSPWGTIAGMGVIAGLTYGIIAIFDDENGS